MKQGNESFISQKDYMKIAIPFILSTVTQPLLGAADTAVVGRLADPAYIAGVLVGTVIFNTMYWLFGFLRVSTTGFSAQAYGSNSPMDRTTALFRPGAMALFIGLIFLALQAPVFKASIWILSPEADVHRFCAIYFKILVWGAPLVLLNYVMLGWLMGQGKIKASIFMQISSNMLNIALDFFFVYGLGMNVGGVAAATLISQGTAFAIGVFFIKRYGDFDREGLSIKVILDKKALSQTMRVNSDLMLRTVCLLVQINVFTATSATFGTAVLSTNAIILQVQGIISYTFDGLANASSVYAGKASGQKNPLLLRSTWKRTLQWIGAFAVSITAAYALLRKTLVFLFTDIQEIIVLVERYDLWLMLYPLMAGIGVGIYGIFTGMTLTRPVRNSTMLALLLFLAVWAVAVPILGNHGLWMALLSFYFGRSIFLLPQYKKTFEKLD